MADDRYISRIQTLLAAEHGNRYNAAMHAEAMMADLTPILKAVVVDADASVLILESGSSAQSDLVLPNSDLDYVVVCRYMEHFKGSQEHVKLAILHSLLARISASADVTDWCDESGKWTVTWRAWGVKIDVCVAVGPEIPTGVKVRDLVRQHMQQTKKGSKLQNWLSAERHGLALLTRTVVDWAKCCGVCHDGNTAKPGAVKGLKTVHFVFLVLATHPEPVTRTNFLQKLRWVALQLADTHFEDKQLVIGPDQIRWLNRIMDNSSAVCIINNFEEDEYRNGNMAAKYQGTAQQLRMHFKDFVHHIDRGTAFQVLEKRWSQGPMPVDVPDVSFWSASSVVCTLRSSADATYWVGTSHDQDEVPPPPPCPPAPLAMRAWLARKEVPPLPPVPLAPLAARAGLAQNEVPTPPPHPPAPKYHEVPPPRRWNLQDREAVCGWTPLQAASSQAPNGCAQTTAIQHPELPAYWCYYLVCRWCPCRAVTEWGVGGEPASYARLHLAWSAPSSGRAPWTRASCPVCSSSFFIGS